ncbi:putative flavodoxin [Methanocella paludicola SANAE]|uniref:Flavodoxin n=1 Tax=Methanocella paludicola (strain DSM 17711 / JCM 13418 / NBRC 101707 / SANAE) TaxID=304371 RepID=D1Z2A2_METPS|nr:flavodoxin domain-containing protein [Methanocella paludicola]BAI62824.1 putative flavodoxin [Methanocella paludicola SANAE]
MLDVLIIYDTNTGNTEKAAQEILGGVKESGASVEMKKVDDTTVEDLKAARGIILGSPNIYGNYSGKMRDLVNSKLVQAKPSDKVGAAFGTYKWNDDNLKNLQNDLRWKGVRIVSEGVNVHRHSNGDVVKKLRELGRKVGEEAKKAR